jgi:hypothetical protein
VFKFFLLRLLEDLMSIADLYTFSLNLPPTHPYSNLLTEVDSRPQCLCMLVQISELEHYYH